MSRSIPYYDLSFQNKALKKELQAAVSEVIDKGCFVLGPEVDAFESEFAKCVHHEHVVAVNSGTSALHLALLALGIGPGDEVITTPFTFAATAWAISYVGARPVFVDVDPVHYNIDPLKIDAAVTTRTKAVMVVHLYGHPCDMDPIVRICDKHKLYLVEDAAQAHGARYKAQPIGTFSNVTGYSFYPTKNLGAIGEGGAVATDEARIAERVRRLRNHGSTVRYKYEEVGYNYRMEGIQGAALRVKLKYLEKWNLQRIHAAVWYNEFLEDITDIQLPIEAPWAESVYHLYTISVPKRDAFCEHLSSHGIGFSTHYTIPMHLQKCYESLGLKKGSMPVAEKAGKEVVNLPLFPGITRKQVETVAKVIKQFYC